MASLYFKYSTMGGGKSIEALKVAYNYSEMNKKPLLFTSAIDNRYKIGEISSRIGLHKSAIPVFENTNIYDIVKKENPDCVIVDEAQFLKKHHIYELSDIVDYLNIPVLAYGLKNDFRNELFEGSYYLLVLADKIENIPSICHCGKKAMCNAKVINNVIIKDGNQIEIGGNELYIPLCRKHYKDNILK